MKMPIVKMRQEVSFVHVNMVILVMERTAKVRISLLASNDVRLFCKNLHDLICWISENMLMQTYTNLKRT